MFKLPVFYNPSRLEAFCIAIAMICTMGYLIIWQSWMPHMPIITAIICLLIYGLLRKIPFADLQQGMISSVQSSFGAVYLFFFIGLFVSALMMCGTIPSIMYYGFYLISPDYFYLCIFIICAIIGTCIGSSLTTCATIGVAFIGMSSAFDANIAITAGAIVSGAFFADKMSPISDTTIMTASTVGIDLFEHIKNMAFTTIPALIISSLIFGYLSPSQHQVDLDQINQFQQQLIQTGLVHWYAFIPFILLIVLALYRINAIVIMLIIILFSIAISYLHLTPSLTDLGNYFYSGFNLTGNHSAEINSLISRGGIANMFFSLTIIILALSLGGLLFALGIIPTILTSLQHFLISAARSTFAVATCAVGVNFLIGEQYLSILLSGETFKPIYTKLGLHKKNLARTLEDAGTIINPLVPWSVCGVFLSSTLGVPVWQYAIYSCFCYLCLLLTLIFGFTGLTISKK